VAVNATFGETTVFLATDDGRNYAGSACLTVRWQVENVKTVELNGVGVVGSGEETVCDAAPAIKVVLLDERDETVDLIPLAMLSSQGVRLALTLIAVLIGGALWLNGITLPRSIWPAGASIWPDEPLTRAGWRWHYLTLLGLIVCATFIRWRYIDQPMRNDETGTFLNYARLPVSEIISNYDTPNNQVLHTLLVHGAVELFGSSPATLRLPAFIGGILIVPATYWAGRSLYNRAAGLIAAGLAAASHSLILYSTNARGYTLMILAALLLWGLAARLRQRQDWRTWGLFAILAALGVYTNPAMVYPLVGTGAWLLLIFWLEQSGRQRWLSLRNLFLTAAVSLLLALLLYAPILLSAGLDSLVSNDFVRPRPWDEFISQGVSRLTSAWNSWQTDIPPLVATGLGAGFVAALLRHRHLAAYAVAPAVISVVALLPLIFVQGVVGWDRIWLFLLPLYFITAAAGFSWLMVRWRAQTVVIISAIAVVLTLFLGGRVIVSNSVVESDATGLFHSAEGVVALLAPQMDADDFTFSDERSIIPMRYYLWRSGGDLSQLEVAEPLPPQLYVVVNTQRYTLDSLTWSYPHPMQAYGEAETLAEFDDATVYRLRRLPEAPE
jgi:hypothetical protein